MTAGRRLMTLIGGLMTLICAAIMIYYPEDGYLLVVFLLDITLLVYALKNLIYYFTMARFMVGGQACLYKGIISLDMGVFVFNLDDLPKRIVMLYLIGYMIFNGVVDIFHSLEAKRLKIGKWRYECFYGAVNVIIALISLFFLDSLKILTLIYAGGLIHSGISRVVSAFRKTAIAYIS